MNEFDELTQRLLNRAEQDLASQLMVSHSSDRLALKERQLRDLADALKRLDPKNSAIEEFEREAAQAEAEAKAYREKALKEMQKQAAEDKERLRKQRESKDQEKTERLK